MGSFSNSCNSRQIWFISRSISCKVLSVFGLIAIAEAGLSVDGVLHELLDAAVEVEGIDDFLGIVGGLLEVVEEVVVEDVFLVKVSTDELRLSLVVFSSVRRIGGWGGV